MESQIYKQMIMAKEPELIIEQADEYASLKSFVSGNEQMDEFVHDYLAACSKSHFCVTYYVRLEPKGEVIALFSLSNDSVDLGEDDFDDMRIGAAGTDLPIVAADFRERFEQKCTYPALEITYLAVNKKYQKLKIGTTLINFIANIARNQNVSGCVFLTVNALQTKEYSAVPFYEKNHFAKLTPVPQLDVWPMYKTLWYKDNN